MNENPPVVDPKEVKPATVGTKPEGDVFNMPPEEKLDVKNVKPEITAEINISEIISYFKNKGDEARKETSIKQSIFKSLKTAFTGSSHLGNFFTKENETRLSVWAKTPGFKQFTKDDVEKILAQAKADNYEGDLGTTKNEAGQFVLCYRDKNQVPWTVDQTKVME